MKSPVVQLSYRGAVYPPPPKALSVIPGRKAKARSTSNPTRHELQHNQPARDVTLYCPEPTAGPSQPAMEVRVAPWKYRSTIADAD